MKKVLISGGSRGIGRACVRAFCAAGDSVAFIYHSSAEAARKLASETGALPFCADLTDAESARAAVRAATDTLGGLDVLVNCAGVSQIKLFTDITDGDWRRMLDTDLGAAFVLSQEAARVMIGAHSGRIINIGSVWGGRGASCEVHYSAAKAGIRGLTQALARELGPSDITVNCVEPGVIDTDMNAPLDDDTLASLIDATPLCRLGTPHDVAAAVTFLASDAAGFITGAILPVDGGFPS